MINHVVWQRITTVMVKIRSLRIANRSHCLDDKMLFAIPSDFNIKSYETLAYPYTYVP